ncbi:MAG: class I SAM-dependent methyltransferase [Rhodospirillaceae bacterium]|nr:class I SAM-dependent methyltransferase [Rhodospirillaceae bacterium]
MSRTSMGLSESLSAYLRRVGAHEDTDLKALRAETAPLSAAGMQIGAEQGRFMALLVELTGAKKALEVGTFTGYSAMAVVKAMGPNGKLTALDVSKEFTDIARKHWAKAGIAGQIDLRLAPATESLAKLIAAGESGTYDFAFIDANKADYDAYYEAALKLVRTGGLIAIDNVLWGGAVIDITDNSVDTVAIRAINEKLATDSRVSVSMIPIGDGLTLARKK